MIKLIFSIQREVFAIIIDNKEIFYKDRKFQKPIRIIPPDPNAPKQIKEMVELTEEEKQEYQNAKTEDELAEICIKDCRGKGAILLKRENGSR